MAVSNETINDWWAQNAGASDAQIAGMMSQYGVSADQLANAIGFDSGAIQQRYDAVQEAYNPTIASGSYNPTLANAPDSSATKASEMTPLDIAKYYYSVSAGRGGDSEYNRQAAINYLKSAGVSDPLLQQGYQEYLASVNSPGVLSSPSTGGMMTPPKTQGTTPTASSGGYKAPSVTPQMTAAQIAQLYKQYTDTNGGDTIPNRNAAIDYLRQSGLSDEAIGQAYQTFLSMQGGGQPTQTPKPPTQAPASSTPQPSGMTNLQSGGNYFDTLNNYYGAYFGGASPDMGLLNSWYGSDYTPRATGYQKSPTQAAPTTTPTGTNQLTGQPYYDPESGQHWR